MANLPTVPGTVISFRSDFESADDGPFLYGATLIVGALDSAGDPAVAVWGTADLTDIEDELNSFTEDFLADQSITVISQPEKLPEPLSIDTDEILELEYGSVLRVSIYGDTVYQTFAPLYLDQETGEVAEAGWISAYGEVVDFAEAESIELIYRGA